MKFIYNYYKLRIINKYFLQLYCLFKIYLYICTEQIIQDDLYLIIKIIC